MADIFIVDDELDIRNMVADILSDEGHVTKSFSSDKELIDALSLGAVPKLILLDIWLKGSKLDGVALLEHIKAFNAFIPVIMISGHGNIEIAVSSIKKGAYEFIEKPFNSDRLMVTVNRALENARLVRENYDLRYQQQIDDNMVGSSEKINSVKSAVDKVSPSGARVLITGSAGTGKEVAARAIHNKSERAQKPFVLFNCAGAGNHLNLERELEDAFKKAEKGTLVLDEIGYMPMVIQGKLLKLLQDSSDSVRIITITNQDLMQKQQAGEFREDLYYRLNVVPIHIPPLTERKDDIEELASYFIGKYCTFFGVGFKGFTESAKVAMKRYEWPGNVRQVKNTMEWIAIMNANGSKELEISLEKLPAEIYAQSSKAPAGSQDYLIDLPLKEAREEFEKDYLNSQILRLGSIAKVAEFIGMERTALHRKMKQLGIGNKK